MIVTYAVPRQKHGLTLDEVEQMLAAMGETPADLRDAALLSLASELARPSELVALALEQLTFNTNGIGRVRFAKRKADQEGAGALLSISAAAWPDGVAGWSTPRSGAVRSFVRFRESSEKMKSASCFLDATTSRSVRATYNAFISVGL